MKMWVIHYYTHTYYIGIRAGRINVHIEYYLNLPVQTKKKAVDGTIKSHLISQYQSLDNRNNAIPFSSEIRHFDLEYSRNETVIV